MAFEVSRQLLKLGKAVKGLVLVDSPAPINHTALPEEIITYLLNKGHSGASTKMVVSDAAQKARANIQGQFKLHASLLENYNPQVATPEMGYVDVPCVILRCLRTMDTKGLCGVDYPWLNDAKFSEETVQLWEMLTGRKIPVLELNCSHFEVFEPDHVRFPLKITKR